MAVKYTPDQARAIESRGQDLLVSASAGSGKTSVLVERVIREIMDDHLEVNQLLVITFTRAAASEMKQRIKQRLQDRLQEETDASQADFLRRQLAEIDTAIISTIDSFCLDVIRRFYFAIDIDPDFSILTDATQIELLKERALRDVENGYLQNEDQAKKDRFLALYDAFAGDSNANSARDLLLDLYQFAMARPNYRAWLQKLSAPYQLETSDVVDSSLWQEKIKPYLEEEFFNLADKMTALMAEADFDHEKFAKYQPAFTAFATSLASYRESLATDDPFDRQRELLAACQFDGTLRTNKEIASFVAEAKEVKEAGKQLVFNVYTSFYASSNADQQALLAKGAEIASAAAEVELAFIDRFNELKRADRVLDFSDMEQLAYEILTQDSSNSDLARAYYQNRFKEIMVDEYQDTNALQDGLIQRLKKAGKNNLFMVGDVKQSIYGFRQAEPSLFIAKYDEYGQENSAGKQRIIFAENFRSSQPVTQAVNLIFDSLLTKDFGGIDYQKEGQLKFAAGYDPEAALPTETEVLYQEDSSATEDDGELNQGDLAMVISRIQKLIADQTPIFDPKTGQTRPVSYGDIAILTRSKTSNLDIKQEFDRYGVPLFVMDVQNYFQTFELTVIMSYLKIIDNPDQDIPLVAVLRSPIFNFSSSDLAEIRLVNKSVSFYSALRTYAKKDTDLAARCRDFLAQLQDLRDFSLSHRISELLWTIYERTSFLEIVTAMTNGQQRRLNLTALYERASAYESSGFKDLYQFINFIARMRKNQKDLAQPILSENAGNSVKLMTIHASKGLEFPVVFVLGLEHRYNYQQDITGSYVLDASGLGLSFAYPFDDPEYRADTLANAWLKIAKKQKLLEEEARLLYVALTRAKQKLILAANIKLPAKTELAGLEEKWTKEISAGRLPLLDKMKVAKPLDFLAPALARAKQVKRLGEKAVSDLAVGQESSLVFVHFDPKKDQAQLPASEAKANIGVDLTEDEEAVFKQAEKLYAFSQGGYPYLDASRTTAYQAVSEIKKAFGDPIEDELADAHISGLQSANRYLQPIDTEPDFLFQNMVSSAELGTASHLVLQYYDYTKGDKDAIDSCIAGLVEKGRLSQTLASKLDREGLSWFVKSDFAKDFYQQPDHLHREENFATILSPKTLFKDFSDFPGEILVHGTIDGYYEAENGIILFDYKTDHVNPRKQEEAIQKLKEKYLGQLRLYERALNESGKLPVLKKYLVLLSCREIVEVD